MSNDIYVKVPKGTRVYTGYSPDGLSKTPNTITTRDSVTKVYNVYQTFHYGPGPNPNPRMVSWANGNKYTEVTNVVEVDPPAPRKDTVSKGPSLRQRMIKGTMWKLTQDAQIVKAKRVPITYGPGRVGYTYEQEPDFVLPAGTEFTITGKSKYNYHWTGTWMPIKVNGYAKDLLVELKELNKNPEQIGEVEVIPMFAIWDTKKKQYYSGYEWDRSSHSPITYTDKLTKAKKFKRLADVRAHALIQTGYYENLPETWGSVPEWMMGEKSFDIPDTWEIVKFDKLTKKEIERIELVDTFKRSWRLRDLTVKYSSTLRKVYSDLEKKNKLKDWSAIMMFKKKSDENYGYWAEELDPKEIADINNLLGRFGDDVKIQKGTSGFAVAIKNASTATMIRLAYQGNLECAIIDFKSMEEVFETKNNNGK